VDHFLKFAEFWVWVFVEQVQSVLLLEMGQMWDYDIRPKPKVWAGSVHLPLTSKRCHYILA